MLPTSSAEAEIQPETGRGGSEMGAKESNQRSLDDAGASEPGRGGLKVPSRSSSQQRNLSLAASTGLSGATVTDHRNSIGGRSGESKGSFAGRQRKGSASSNRSGGDSDQGNTLRNSQPSSPSASDQKKKKRAAGFFSFLGCCGVPDAANTVDDGDPDHVHKVEKLPQRPATAKPPPQDVPDHPPVQQLNEKEPHHETAASSNDDGHQASGSGENAVASAEEHDEEPKQPAPPAVTVNPPSQAESQEKDSPASDSPDDDKDVEMQDSGPEPGPPDGPIAAAEREEPQQKVMPPPPPGPGPAAMTPLPLAEQGPAAQEPHKWLLPPVRPELKGRKCLVLDLDETLVHSSFKILNQADFTIPVEIEGNYHNVYVIKRPGVDEFMKRVGELYEVVVFTASVSKYGNPLLDQLDIHNVVHHRLFRESCYNHQGNYVKDLSQVGRDLKETIIIDNSPTSYIFHPQHAVPISSWFSDAHDNELLDLIPVLEDLAGPNVTDVSLVLDVTL